MNNDTTGQRSVLIGAIINNDLDKLKLLSGKRVVVLDTFVDGLKYSRSDMRDDDSVTVIVTERFEKMMQEIKNHDTII